MSKSPFPGMDPYLEQAWRDVHHCLCTYTRDDLQPQLAGGLRARVDERLVVEQPPYYAIVHRGWVGRTYEYYPMPLERRLSAIGIPVRPSEPAAVLDIQGLIDRVYRNGAYDQEIDYAIDPTPPLNEEAARWADGLLKKAGVR